MGIEFISCFVLQEKNSSEMDCLKAFENAKSKNMDIAKSLANHEEFEREHMYLREICFVSCCNIEKYEETGQVIANFSNLPEYYFHRSISWYRDAENCLDWIAQKISSSSV